MVETLTLRNNAGVLIGVIESIDGSLRVKYTNSNKLKLFFEELILNGINVQRYSHDSVFRINTKPRDANFLEELGRYLQCSFSYLPCVYRARETYYETSVPQKTVLTIPDIDFTFHTIGKWINQSADILNEIPIVTKIICISCEEKQFHLKSDDLLQLEVASSGWC